MDLQIGLVISQILAFIAMLWILKKFAWQPLLGVMEERRKRIETEFKQIEEQKEELKALKGEYRDKIKAIEGEVKARMQKAIDDGQRLAQQIQQEAKEQAKAILQKAQTDLSLEVSKAKMQLKSDIVTMVVSATEKLIHAKLSDEKQDELITELVDQVELR